MDNESPVHKNVNIYVVTHQFTCALLVLFEIVLLSTHNICFG